MPKIVDAGKRGESSEPSRNTVLIGANRPWFVGTSIPPALISIRNAMRIAPSAEAGGMFVKPGAWSSVSLKSNVISEPATVISTAIR